MPHKNVVRHFAPDSVYHCYNRGVEKRQIYMDEQDYGVFLNRIKQMLSDPETLDPETNMERLKSYYGDVELLGYCLMPNHFHLLLYQHSERGVSEFMRTLSTSYTMYFNRRYDRVGSLFQGSYKARHITQDGDWLHISRYIHLNPLRLEGGVAKYPYSSFRFYGDADTRPSWLLPGRVLDSFRSYGEYEAFVMSCANTEQFSELASNYSLE